MVLTCLMNDTGVSTQWNLNDKDLQSTMRRKLDNRIITLQLVWGTNEGGDYQCEELNFVSSHRSAFIRLQVTCK